MDYFLPLDLSKKKIKNIKEKKTRKRERNGEKWEILDGQYHHRQKVIIFTNLLEPKFHQIIFGIK